MTGLPTDSKRSELMKRIRQTRTSPEEVVAHSLIEAKLGYRRNVKGLPGAPDFANKSQRWAIFVNGCYWHHHKTCSRGTVPKRNREFWLDKFAANRKRDAKKARALRQLGFTVLIVWECQAEGPDWKRRLQALCSQMSRNRAV